MGGERVAAVVESLRRWLFRPTTEPRGLAGLGSRLLRIFAFAYRDFLHKFCWERAATLSFVTILSLIPLTVLFLSFVGVFWKEKVKSFVDEKLLVYLVPEDGLRSRLSELSEQLKQTAFELHTGVGIAAAAGLMLAAMALLSSTERIFNRLWEVALPRSYFQKLRIFWIILTTSPVALAVSFYVDQLTASGTVMGHLKKQFWALDVLYSFCLPAVVSFAAFTVLNLFLPRTRVRLLPAVLGAAVSAVLWEGAKKGFYLYVQESRNLSRFYGSLGLIPVFLIWIYLTWLIVLFGATVARAAQEFRRLARGGADGLVTQVAPPSSPFLAVYLLERIYSAFEAGKGLPAVEAVAGQLGLPTQPLEAVAASLVRGGLLVEDGQNPGRYAPARAPALVRVRDVVEALPEGPLREDELESLPVGPDSMRVRRLFTEARGAFLGFLGDRTLFDLVNSDKNKN